MAISGDGFFITRDKAANAAAGDPYAFTRAGQFSSDEEGYLRNAAGNYLYAWPLDENGETAATATDLTALEAVRITNIGGAAEPSSRVSITANLQASQVLSNAVSATVPTYNPNTTAGSMASYAASLNSATTTGTAPDFSTSVQIFDSLGGQRTLTFSFLKADAANQWHAEVYVQPASDIENAGTYVDGQVAKGLVQFSTTGALDTSVFGTAGFLDPNAISIGASADGSSPNAKWANIEGLDAQTISLQLAGQGASSGLTQYDYESALQTSTVNGTAYGSLAAVEIDEEGYLNALFTNGLARRVYQIPLATFSNPDGLVAEPGGVYRHSGKSGPINIKPAGAQGAGILTSKALESSTVDLAEEFSNLITTQRAYSASSKIITTADEMLDELIRLKR